MRLFLCSVTSLLFLCDVARSSDQESSDCLPANATNRPIVALVVPKTIKRVINERLVWPAVQIAWKEVKENPKFLPLVRKMEILKPIDSDCVSKQGYSLFEVARVRFTKAKIK